MEYRYIWNITDWNKNNPQYVVKESNFEKDYRKFLLPNNLSEDTLSHSNALAYIEKVSDDTIKKEFANYIDYKNIKSRNNLIHYTYIWKLNGKVVYCGLSYHPPSRWMNSKRHTREGRKLPLCNAINKLGFDAFEREVVGIHLSLTETKAAEIELIEQHQTLRTKYPENNGYNVSPGGDAWDGKLNEGNFKKRIVPYNKVDISSIENELVEELKNGKTVTSLLEIIKNKLGIQISITNLCKKLEKVCPDYKLIIKQNLSSFRSEQTHWTKRKTKEEVNSIMSKINIQYNFSTDDEAKIIELRKKPTSLKEIANLYNVDRSVIQRVLGDSISEKENKEITNLIHSNKSTGNKGPTGHIPSNKKEFTPEQIEQIVKLRKENTSFKNIAVAYNVDRSVIQRILFKPNNSLVI